MCRKKIINPPEAYEVELETLLQLRTAYSEDTHFDLSLQLVGAAGSEFTFEKKKFRFRNIPKRQIGMKTSSRFTKSSSASSDAPFYICRKLRRISEAGLI